MLATWVAMIAAWVAMLATWVAMLATWVAMIAAWVAMLATWVAMIVAWVAMLATWVAMIAQSDCNPYISNFITLHCAGKVLSQYYFTSVNPTQMLRASAARGVRNKGGYFWTHLYSLFFHR
jgi:hypothetical protein